MRFHELTFFLGRPGAGQNSLDCLLHPDHGVAAPVEQDVGRVDHQLLYHGLDDAAIFTVKPGRVVYYILLFELDVKQRFIYSSLLHSYWNEMDVPENKISVVFLKCIKYFASKRHNVLF